MQSTGRHEALLIFIVQPDIKSLEQLTKLKKTIFDIFRQSIHEQRWLAIHIWIKTHCYTYCLICSSTHLICFTFRRTERAKPYMKLIFFWKTIFSTKIFGQNLVKKKQKGRLKTNCNLCFMALQALGCHIWDKSPKKGNKVTLALCKKLRQQGNTCSLKNWVFNCFCQKLGGKKIRLPKISIPVNYDLAHAGEQKA